MHRMLIFALATAMALTAGAPGMADPLYRYSGGRLFDGAYGPVAAAQTKLSAELSACGSRTVVVADGRFDARTRDALVELSHCSKFEAALADDAEARSGALTIRYWAVLLGRAAPDLDARARTIMLTYEATDYGRAEWNFCQSRPLYDLTAGRLKCISNDPRSYITWGPNGATAGNGREIQLVLQALDSGHANLLDSSFGAEAAAVRRTYNFLDRTASRSLETYLCGVWASPSRRQAWRAGFNAIGRSEITRDTYDRLYASRSLDGGKIATFYRAYAANHLVPTEIDYAFFKDRAAHTTPIQSEVDAAVRRALSSGAVPRWQVRRAIALNVRPSNQRDDRLGRDVAFYVDGATQTGLSAAELTAWKHRGGLHASDVGLSDARSVSQYVPGAPITTAIASPSLLTAEERAACPPAVLETARPHAK